MTLDNVLGIIPLDELKTLKQLAEAGRMDKVLQLLRAYGYDDDDPPPPPIIGQKIKKLR